MGFLCPPRLIDKRQAARKYSSIQKVSILIYRLSFSSPSVSDLIVDKFGVVL